MASSIATVGLTSPLVWTCLASLAYLDLDALLEGVVLLVACEPHPLVLEESVLYGAAQSVVLVENDEVGSVPEPHVIVVGNPSDI